MAKAAVLVVLCHLLYALINSGLTKRLTKEASFPDGRQEIAV
jgi:hypothetical protein